MQPDDPTGPSLEKEVAEEERRRNQGTTGEGGGEGGDADSTAGAVVGGIVVGRTGFVAAAPRPAPEAGTDTGSRHLGSGAP